MVPMPSVIVLIVCKTILVGPPDQNAGYTQHENRDWATEHAMMACRRHEIQLYDQAVDQGADPQPFNAQRCWQSAFQLGPAWDAAHKRSAYRFWRAACPVPTINSITGEVIGWSLPDCGHRDVVTCDVDSEI